MPTPTHPLLLGLALPEPDLAPTLDTRRLSIADHAVRRYRERVERVPRWLALRRIGAMIDTAAWESRPRSWMPVVLHQGTVYAYGAARPDVCLLVRDAAVVTVLSRRFLTAGGAPTEPLPAVPTQRNSRGCRSRPR